MFYGSQLGSEVTSLADISTRCSSPPQGESIRGNIRKSATMLVHFYILYIGIYQDICTSWNQPFFTIHPQDYPINPKSLSLGELYGEFDLSTNEWTDGVLSSVMRPTCAEEKPDQKWLVFDGPVDTLWIESMNSVMDDNKVLTLINGERISMPEQVWQLIVICLEC